MQQHPLPLLRLALAHNLDLIVRRRRPAVGVATLTVTQRRLVPDVAIDSEVARELGCQDATHSPMEVCGEGAEHHAGAPAAGEQDECCAAAPAPQDLAPAGDAPADEDELGARDALQEQSDSESEPPDEQDCWADDEEGV